MQRTIAPADALKALSAPVPLPPRIHGLLNPNLNLTVSFQTNLMGGVPSPIDHV